MLVIDNYDSFVYNIVHTLAELGARSVVVRNDEVTVSGVERMRPDRIVISPGPGSPLKARDVGVSPEVVARLGPRIPVLGVCLGHQVIAAVYGARVARAKRVMHGRVDVIEHYGDKLYRGVPSRFKGARYHSLAIRDPPEELVITARSAVDGEIMGVRHVEHPVHGVQFHPESIATPHGARILGNFLDDPW
ncbi:aminodeoxychorismate/anthranilate synthase component II [Stetteria hydrogenophila]